MEAARQHVESCGGAERSLVIRAPSRSWWAGALANVAHRVCGVHRNAGVLHVIGIYVILGIGCDDLFILLDAFAQSACEAPLHCRGSILGRMRWAYRPAAC